MRLSFLIALTSASSIVQFTPDNENEILDGTKNVLIKFVAPVSGYARKNSPKYELVAKLMKQHSDKVVIAEADADKYVPLGYKYGINGFPSFKWYPVGSKSTDDIKVLDLGVEVLDILAFLKKETGIKVKVSKKELAAVAGVVKITPETVDSILDGSKHVLVKFFGSCEHCYRMKPKFEQAAYEMGIFDSLVFAEVDVEKHKDLGAKYKVGRVPTIKMFFKDNSKPPLDYLGEMETEKIIEYATLVVQMQDMKENAESKKQQVQENLVAEPIKEAPKVVTQKGSPSISIPDGVVVDLTPENFDKIVDGSRHVLVKFYAPWCGHCKTLAPKYVDAASALKGKKEVVIAEVDADKHKDLGSKFGIQGFPTMKWFPKGSTNAEEYTGGREAQDILDFVKQKTGIQAKIKAKVSHVTVLDDSNFKKVTGQGKFVLVEFYAPWCGHCKNLAPIYEQVAEIFANEPNCIVANLDATAAEETAKEYDVQGYPTIKLLTPKGGFKDYSGGRTVADFVKYLNAECDTHRTITGDVDESAGLVKELGDFATQFFKTEAYQLEKLLEAGEVEANNHPTVKTAMFYIRALKKYLADNSYLEKESKRLGGIIDKGALTREKRDDFMSRRNVLNSLIAAKAKSKVGGHEEL